MNSKKKNGMIMIFITLAIFVISIVILGWIFGKELFFKEKEDDTIMNIDNTIQMRIVQVDNSQYPNISYYVNIVNSTGEAIEGFNKDNFKMSEKVNSGYEVEMKIDSMSQVLETDNLYINLVIDQSKSMNDSNKMEEAKEAAKTFLNTILAKENNQVEITTFNDFVYLRQAFTNDLKLLQAALENIQADTGTAFYDAICSAIVSSNKKIGAKCVIAFTDGIENMSSYTFDDVVDLSKSTGIPVFIIGIGNECDEEALGNLAKETKGSYYSAKDENLSQVLSNIYNDIYNIQRECYLVTYQTHNQDKEEDERTIKLWTADNIEYKGECVSEYLPVSTVNESFSQEYHYNDFICKDSKKRKLKQEDLKGMSLAELRIARNEIFARYGRQFRDPLLNQWFYSKEWYLKLEKKYNPNDFEIKAMEISNIEMENVQVILGYENYIMEHSEIFPHHETKLLTEYDISLKKSVLQKGLEEIYLKAKVKYGDKTKLNSIQIQNIELIEEALQKQEIVY